MVIEGDATAKDACQNPVVTHDPAQVTLEGCFEYVAPVRFTADDGCFNGHLRSAL
jgi:hypothetical protein